MYARNLGKLVRARGALATLVLGVGGCAFESQEADSVDATTEALIGGTTTNAKPAVGLLEFVGQSGCTATLISPRHIITAQHCNFGKDTLTTTATFAVGGDPSKKHPVSRWYQWGPVDGAEFDGQDTPDHMHYDVAIAELATPVTAAEATPIPLAATPPAPGQRVTMLGFGCKALDRSGTGIKRFLSFNFGATHALCAGDSGGPALYGELNDAGALWGTNSWSPAPGDVWGNVSHFKEDIMNVIRLWDNTGFTGLEAGFRRNGQMLRTLAQSTVSACKTSCESDAQCNSFSFNPSAHSCVLNRDVGDWVPDASTTSGLSNGPRFETNVNRPGSDYRAFFIADANGCSLECSNDRQCLAYTFVTSSSTCFLKNYLVPSVPGSSMTSGAKRTLEYYTDRGGSDVSDFDLFFPDDVRACEADCSVDSRCLSFTYRNTYLDPSGNIVRSHCWLKNARPTPSTIVQDPPQGNKRLVSGLWRSVP